MSTLKVNTIQNTSGVEVYTAKAWVNFNGTGTVAIRAAGNVSSITDNGTGDYTVNFTNALSDANYAAVVSASNQSSAYPITRLYDYTTVLAASCRFQPQRDTSGVNIDTPYVSVAVFR